MAQWVSQRSVDCCFCAEPGPRVECDWIPLYEDELLAWLPANHPKAAGPFPLADVQTEPFIVTSPDQDTDIDRLMAANHLQPNTRFTTADAYTTYRMVEAGLGMSLNNRLISSKWQGAVATVPFDPPQYISLGIMLPSLQSASPATLRFIDIAREYMAHEREANPWTADR